MSKNALDRMETFFAMAMQGLLSSGDEADDAELVEIAWSIAAAMETKAIKRHERLKASAPPVDAKPAEMTHEEQLEAWLATNPNVCSHRAYLKWAGANKIGPMMSKAAFDKLNGTAPLKDLTPDEQFAAWRAAEPNGKGFDQFHAWAAANRIAQHMGRKQFEAMISPVPAPPPPPPARAA